MNFPEVPDIKAAHASDLTEAEYVALVQYIIAAEKVFDTIAAREAFLDTINNTEDSRSMFPPR